MAKTQTPQSSDLSGLRLRLVGKPLVGFDTKRWSTFDDATPAAARIGGKPTTVGVKPRAIFK